MMDVKQIIANHIQNNGLNTTVDEMQRELNIAAKQPRTKVVRSGDVLFLFSVSGDSALVYIINGTGPIGYVKAIRQFVGLLKKLEIKFLNMRVQDTESATKIAQSAGLSNPTFELTNEGETDPYTMTAEV